MSRAEESETEQMKANTNKIAISGIKTTVIISGYSRILLVEMHTIVHIVSANISCESYFSHSTSNGASWLTVCTTL